MIQKSTKKNASIMFTDIVNFTHFMSVDEKKALNFLEHKKSILNQLVQSYNGEYIKDIGDGTLTYYQEANDALSCALELHSSLKQYTGIDIRVGIHFGEIISINNDIYGDDVNIASRLEHLSPEGGICISSVFYKQLKNKVKTDYIGLQSFKGVGRLIDVYAINDKNLKRPNLANYSTKNISINKNENPSLILFPFSNKGEKKDDFYAYGLSVDILSELSTNNQLRVASLNDVEPMLKKRYKFSTICKKLDSRYYIAGGFWKQNDNFNLSINLIDTKTKKTIWSNSWMEGWNKLSTIKNKIVHNILRILSNKENDTTFTNEELSDSNTEAYQLYLKAKYFFKNRKSDKDHSKIESLLKQSIQSDKNFISPYILFGNYFLATNNYNQSLKYFESGLDISVKNKNEKHLATSLNGIGKIYYLKGKFNKALEFYNKALQIWEKINNYEGQADTLNLIGSIHDYNGRYDDALKFYEKSYKMYKRSNFKLGLCKTSFNIANAYCTKGDSVNALRYQELSFNLSKDTNNAVMLGYNYNLRGVVYSNNSQPQEAYELFKKSLNIRKSLNDQEGIATLYRNIGVVYLAMGLLKQSIGYYKKSLEICDGIGYYLGVLDCHMQLGKAYKQMGDYESAISHYNISIDNISQTEDKFKLSKTMNLLGGLYIKMGQYEEALEYYKKSKLIKKEISDQVGIGYSLLGISRVLSWQGKYQDAIKNFNKCIKIGIKFNDFILITDSNHYLSYIYLNKYNYKKAMEFVDRAILLSKQEKLKSRSAKFYDCKGLIYKYMNNLDGALKMHEKALQLSHRINDRHGIRQYLNNKGLIFEERAQFENAMNIYAECLSISKQMNEKRSICVSYCNIGYILEYQGAFTQSLKYFKRAYDLATKIGYQAGVGGYCNNMAQVYLKQGKYKKAIPLFEKAQKILMKLEAIDYLSCFIGRIFCAVKIECFDNIENDLQLLEKKLDQTNLFNDYKAFSHLFQIYYLLNHKTLGRKYVNLSYKSLMMRIKNISNSIDKDNFLKNYDSKIIIEFKNK